MFGRRVLVLSRRLLVVKCRYWLSIVSEILRDESGMNPFDVGRIRELSVGRSVRGASFSGSNRALWKTRKGRGAFGHLSERGLLLMRLPEETSPSGS